MPKTLKKRKEKLILEKFKWKLHKLNDTKKQEGSAWESEATE